MLGVVTGIGVCGSGHTLMGRILGNSGVPITQASLASIAYAVRDLTAGTTITSGVALTISSVVFDSLQQADPRWTKDSASSVGEDGRYGYNFLATLPATLFTAFDVDADTEEVTTHRYQVDVTFTPASGQPFRQAFQFPAVPTWP